MSLTNNVSILVLMEVALEVGAIGTSVCGFINVSILVLMEVALEGP